MKKVAVKGTLVNDQVIVILDGSGAIEDGKLKWMSEQDKIQFCFNLKQNQLEKEDTDSRMSVLFALNERSIIKYELKETNDQIDIPIVTTKLQKDENQIEVCYKVQEECNLTNEIQLKISFQFLV